MSTDAESVIVEDYTQSMEELTFPSRPVIDNLTTIAKENTIYADGISKAIINRIYKCIPEYKLYSLFLLDSVCRNVGSPYNALIGNEIFKIFSHVYLLVNDEVRQKMFNLFEIWRTTTTKGTNLPLFPQDQMDKIANFLSQAQSKSTKDGGRLTVKRLINDIDGLMPVFQKKLMGNPDPKLAERFNALNQLKALLSSQTVTENSLLLQVQAHLNSIRDQELGTFSKKPSQGGGATALPPTPQSHEVSKKKVDELFKGLILSNLIIIEQSFSPGAEPTYRLNFPKKKYQHAAKQNNVDLASYSVLEQLVNHNSKSALQGSSMARTEFERMVFWKLASLDTVSHGLQNFVNSSEIPKSTVALLYEAKPSKCGICGKRFSEDESGVAKRRMHLDWHFRINKKMSTKNIQSRIWYLDDIDWVRFKDEELLEYFTPTTSTEVRKPTEEEEEAKEIPYVTIPANETNMNNKCQICRDSIKATYNDDLGEWCWYNCIRVPGEKNVRKIVHATCYQEAKKRGAEEDLNTRVKREKF